MSNQHTPGPWTFGPCYVEAGKPFGYYVNGPKSEADEYGITERICTTPNVRWGERQIANARLIAAAPETAAERDRLREINQELIEALAGLIDPHGDMYCGECPMEPQQIARAVLAHARGEE